LLGDLDNSNSVDDADVDIFATRFCIIGWDAFTVSATATDEDGTYSANTLAVTDPPPDEPGSASLAAADTGPAAEEIYATGRAEESEATATTPRVASWLRPDLFERIYDRSRQVLDGFKRFGVRSMDFITEWRVDQGGDSNGHDYNSQHRIDLFGGNGVLKHMDEAMIESRKLRQSAPWIESFVSDDIFDKAEEESVNADIRVALAESDAGEDAIVKDLNKPLLKPLLDTGSGKRVTEIVRKKGQNR
jgi:hypothetical protein